MGFMAVSKACNGGKHGVMCVYLCLWSERDDGDRLECGGDEQVHWRHWYC